MSSASYNHGSAQNIDIITQFMCDTLVNSCGADQTAQTTCANAKAAADTVTAETGGQADKFNAVFGITTDFAADAVIDDQGNTISPGLSTAPTAAAASDTAVATEAVSAGYMLLNSSLRQCFRSPLQRRQRKTQLQLLRLHLRLQPQLPPPASGSASAIGNFGKCSVPQIEFGVGFDGRKETSFQPVDKSKVLYIHIKTPLIYNSLQLLTITALLRTSTSSRSSCATRS